MDACSQTQRTPSVSVSLTQAVLLAAVRLGLDRESLLAASGLQEAQLGDPDARIDFPRQESLWGAIQSRLPSHEPGLALGRALSSASFSALGYLLQSSTTLGEALESGLRYQRLVGEGGQVTIEPQAEVIWVAYRPLNPEQPATRARALALLSFWARQLKALLPGLQLAGCRFMHRQPEHLDDYATAFACPLHFDTQDYALGLPKAMAGVALPQANASLRDLLRQHAEGLLARLPSASVSGRVVALLGEQLTRGEPGRAAVASELGLSERTLQRRLAEEGSSYQQLLADTRRQLAERYLSEGNLPATDIAALLGYSEPSVFFRAFRNWTRLTPGEYRQLRRRSDNS
ncbi:AraC family transcriptional regulator [Pseudomonas sp. MT3]|uniref:AraC family transcriptional regulator n=1 Tax=Pseudomonas sp. ATCC 13867 TaxID=1294143 RepID=UPI00034DA45F|nr:AraC family transcriptional regulator [Pseudomonas sp. ATCC 13867]RFQ26069.1 AraC family transcriptional regulator [Pseudomonas sp. ATCC 13867]